MRTLLATLCLPVLCSVAFAQDGTLTVTGPQPAIFVMTLGGSAPAPIQYTLSNTGNPAFKVDWQSDLLGPAVVGITATPSSGSIPPGGPAQTLTLTLNPAAYTTVKNYSGVLRIVHLKNDGFTYGNFYQFDVFVVVQEPGTFAPGDTLVGVINDPADIDFVGFYGLKGMTLKLTVKQSTEVKKLRIRLVDELGATVKTWKLSTSKTEKRQYKLKSTGLFVVKVDSKDGSVGDYKILTGRKLPTFAKPRTLTKVEAAKGQTYVQFKVAALPGAIVNVNFHPNGALLVADLNPITVTDPASANVSLAGFLYASDVAKHLIKLPLNDLGIYAMRVDGLILPGDKVTIPIAPFQPEGSSTVDLDA